MFHLTDTRLRTPCEMPYPPERVTVNHDVVGSSPTGGAKNTPKIDVFGVFSYVKTKK